MEITVTGRHMEVSDGLREYVTRKIQDIVKDVHKITSAKVVLDMQKGRSKAEIIIHGKHLDIESDFESYDMHQSIDNVMEKAAKQIDKFMDKIQDHHKFSKLKEAGENEVELEEKEEI